MKKDGPALSPGTCLSCGYKAAGPFVINRELFLKEKHEENYIKSHHNQIA